MTPDAEPLPDQDLQAQLKQKLQDLQSFIDRAFPLGTGVVLGIYCGAPVLVAKSGTAPTELFGMLVSACITVGRMCGVDLRWQQMQVQDPRLQKGKLLR